MCRTVTLVSVRVFFYPACYDSCEEVFVADLGFGLEADEGLEGDERTLASLEAIQSVQIEGDPDGGGLDQQ